MSADYNQSDILRFLNEPVPPGGTPAWADWQARCKQLGAKAPEIFVQTLESGPEPLQYAALLGLRLYGFEAWADGYGKDMKYRFRPLDSSDWTIVIPEQPPKSATGE